VVLGVPLNRTPQGLASWVGHVLAEGADGARVVVEAIRRGDSASTAKPERVYTDRGSAFTAWRDVHQLRAVSSTSSFVDPFRLAHGVPAAGAAARLNRSSRTVQRELWEVVHFDSVEEGGRRALVKFFSSTTTTAVRTWAIGSLVSGPTGSMGPVARGHPPRWRLWSRRRQGRASRSQLRPATVRRATRPRGETCGHAPS